MATQSIIRNIVIKDSFSAENFVTALEKASELHHTSSPIKVKDVKGNDIKKLLEGFVK